MAKEGVAVKAEAAQAQREIKPFFLDLDEREIDGAADALRRILRSGQLILGPYTREFESEFAKYAGKRFAVALNSGTSALEVLLTAHRAHGKRIAVPSNTNFASVAAILRTGGRPVYMDMTKEYFVPNLEILRDVAERHRVEGVLWVHIGGIIAPDFVEVVEYCRRNRLFLIEDAAHAHGSQFKGIKGGSFADGGAFSFFPTKVMTTIEGGMIVTDEEEHALLARSLRNQGKRDGDYGGLHYDLGSSWRISEISAYLGLVQLAKLDRMIASRADVAHRVTSALRRARLDFCDTSHMDRASNYKVIVTLPSGKSAAVVKEALGKRGVICGGGVYDIPCHQHPVFKNVPYASSDLRETEAWCPRHICPPITSGLTEADADRLGSALVEVLTAA
jgi:perosamine synthetase